MILKVITIVPGKMIFLLETQFFDFSEKYKKKLLMS
jgi:hypothetical protein